MWFVYLLRCSDLSLYCGITNNISKRLACHNSGKGSRYTRARLPVEVVWWNQCDSRSSATKKEIKIKELTKNKKELLVSKGANSCPKDMIEI